MKFFAVKASPLQVRPLETADIASLTHKLDSVDHN